MKKTNENSKKVLFSSCKREMSNDEIEIISEEKETCTRFTFDLGDGARRKLRDAGLKEIKNDEEALIKYAMEKCIIRAVERADKELADKKPNKKV